MVLKFKQRGNEDVKKVLIYGEDGSGKSTFAETYCRKNNLNPVCIDIDDTNYTNVPIIELDLGSDIKAYKNIKRAIAEIISDGSFDTIILDGVTSMLELFVSKAKGLKKYSDRAERFNDVLRDLLNSKMNVIFIGQIDMKVIHNEEFQSPKPIIKINSIVNEKYLCYHKKEGYSHKVIKFRQASENKAPKNEPKRERPKQIIKEAKPEVEPEVKSVDVENDDLPIMEMPAIIDDCINALVSQGRKVTNDIVKICIQDHCKDDAELQECMTWLDNINLGGK